MPSNIVAPRVPLTDPKTGLVSREWYSFFLALFEVTGSGQNPVSLTDLQGGPPPVSLETVTALANTINGFSDIIATIQQAPPTPPLSGVATMMTTATLDFPSTAANSSNTLTVTLPGAVDGDVVTLGVPQASIISNSVYTAWVSAPDTVSVRFVNNSSTTAVDPASGVFRVVATRY